MKKVDIQTQTAHTTRDELLAAWREQLVISVQQPMAAQLLKQPSQQDWPRFYRFYKTLQALPRRRRRSLQRRLKQSLAGVALLLALGSEPALAATINVDGVDCTLIDAITAANTDSAIGGCEAGSGADVITLRPGSTHTLTSINSTDTNFRSVGLPIITSEIHIEGNGATIERANTAPEFGILRVEGPNNRDTPGEQAMNFTLEQTTITGGQSGLSSDGANVTIADSTISGNSGSGVSFSSGYSYYLASSPPASLVIKDSTISGNSGKGVDFSTGSYHYYSSPAILDIKNSTISDNSATGVSIYGRNFNATTSITDSTISGNGSSGVFIEADETRVSATIVNNTISDNSGTGVIGAGGPNSRIGLSIVGSTLSGNTGGVFAFAGYSGSAHISIANSTISGNLVRGGLYFAESYSSYVYLNVADTTITGNSAGISGGGVHLIGYKDNAFIFNRVIISGNSAPSGPEVYYEPYPDSSATFPATLGNNNLFGVDGEAGVEGIKLGSADIVPAPGVLLADILDPVLADNGGPTQTHALVEMSPAIDAIASTEPDCNGVDQRGVSRPQDGDADGVAACDVGAYEFADNGNAVVVPFARFNIKRALVKLTQNADRDRFKMSGRLRLSANSDGLDVLNEAVVVTFDDFSETIPAGSFRPIRQGGGNEAPSARRFVYDGASTGIKRMTLKLGRAGAGGEFFVDARGLNLDRLKLPAKVDIKLQIGNDQGTGNISFNQSGTFGKRKSADE